jgi:phage shock protein A
VSLKPRGSTDLAIEEATPVERTLDIRSPSDMEAVRAYLSSGRAEEPLKTQLMTLAKLQQDIGSQEQRIATLREQMDAYRTRMEELHGQVFTLKAVKTGGAIMKNLEKKLGEMSDRLSQATVDLASAEEKLLVMRIKLQDGIAELTLDKPAASD